MLVIANTFNLYCLIQGPALYAYNDAVFSENDWKGIGMLQDSVKNKDPMKVGRFGLGFKSVFHLTGMPFNLNAYRYNVYTLRAIKNATYNFYICDRVKIDPTFLNWVGVKDCVLV